MTKKGNIILTVSIATISLGLLVPSVVVTGLEGGFFPKSEFWEIDLSDINRENLSSLKERILETLLSKDSFSLASFTVTFSKEDKLEDGLVFFEVGTGMDYQLQIKEDKGTILKVDTKNDIGATDQIMTDSILSMISLDDGNTDIQRRYDSKGKYVSQGSILDKGINNTITNYLWNEDTIEEISSLPKGKEYFNMEESIFSSSNAFQVSARYYFPY